MPRWLMWHKSLLQDACREMQIILFSGWSDLGEDILSITVTKNSTPVYLEGARVLQRVLAAPLL